MKKIILVAGRTASGKSTLVADACERHGLKQVVSYATRPMREGETNGVDHIFIDKEEVEKYKNKMAAYTKIGEYEYFATTDVLDRSDFYVIDPNGIDDLQRRFGHRYNFVILYVYVPIGLCETRAKIRKDDPEVVRKRIEAEDEQFSAFEKKQAWDFGIVNDGAFELSQKAMDMVLHEEKIIP